MSYEKQDASLRLVGIAAALLAFGIAASLGASAWWYAARYRAAVTPDPAGEATSFTHGPAAEPDIRRDWREVEASARARLEGYAWVDRDAGIARIPIERAMALIAAGAKPAPGTKEPGQVP